MISVIVFNSFDNSLKSLFTITVFFSVARACCGWCGWHQNASLLPVWGHSQHGIKDGINE